MRNVLLWLAIGMLGAAAPAAADGLTVKNCTGQTIAFKTYNERDGVCWVARNDVSIGNCSVQGLTCDGKCQVTVMGSNFCGSYGKLNGSWTVLNSISTKDGYRGPWTSLVDRNGKYWMTMEAAACGC
jgi:hypothetical protein